MNQQQRLAHMVTITKLGPYTRGLFCFAYMSNRKECVKAANALLRSLAVSGVAFNSKAGLWVAPYDHMADIALFLPIEKALKILQQRQHYKPLFSLPELAAAGHFAQR